MVTVPYSKRTAAYIASAGQTTFDVPWPVLTANDLSVMIFRGGGRNALNLTPDYIVTNVGAQSGSQITLTVPALLSDLVTIDGARKVERTSQFVSNRAITSDQINTDLTNLMMIAQELRRDVDRSVKRSAADTSSGDLRMPENAVNVLIGVDANGNIVSYPLSSGGSGGSSIALPVAIEQGGTGATTAQAARNNLGLGSLATKNSVSGADITDLSISANDLAPATVTGDKLALGAATILIETSALLAPPATPTIGYSWIVGSGATGSWLGQDNKIATWNGTSWIFTTATRGWQAVSLAEKKLLTFDGTQWQLINPATAVSGKIPSAIAQARYSGGVNRAAVLDGNKVIVWGVGTSGKACSVSNRQVLLPEVVAVEAPGWSSIQRLIIGPYGRYYVIDDQNNLWSAGDGANYCLGHGDVTSRVRFKRVDYFYSQSIKIRDVITSRANSYDNVTVYFVTTDNRLFSAGFNDANGARGDGTTTITAAITQVIDTTNAALTNVDTVSAGGYFVTACARLLDGRIARWGHNATGQLADGTTTSATKAAYHPTIFSAIKTVVSSDRDSGTASGAGNLYVLLSSGSVVGAGAGAGNRLGQGADVANKTALVPIIFPENIVDIASGGGYNGGARAALSVTGKLYVWGFNDTGQLGLGNTTNQSTPIAVPSPPWGVTPVTRIIIAGSVVSGEAVYVQAGNAIYASGYNGTANLCDGASLVAAMNFAPVQGLPADAVIADWNVYGTDFQFGPMILTTDGRLYTGGSGAFGELGWEPGTLGPHPVLQEVFIRGQRGAPGIPGQIPNAALASYALLFG